MKIKLDSNSIEKIKNLLQLCPSSFNYVPLKLFKINDISYVSIETISINGDIVFSGRTEISNIDIDNDTGMLVRLPINKTIINNIFNPEFENIEIDKSKITVKDKRRKLSVALYQMSEDEVMEFPYTNTEIFDMVKEKNDMEDVANVKMTITLDDIKMVNNSLSILSRPEFININNVKGTLKFSSEDYAGNTFECSIDCDKNSKSFEGKYDMNLIEIFNIISKVKDVEYNVIFSPLITAFTLEESDMIVTIALTALKD